MATQHEGLGGARKRPRADERGGTRARPDAGEPRRDEAEPRREPRHVWGGEGEQRPLGAGAEGARGVLEHADPFTHDRTGLVESGYLRPGETPETRDDRPRERPTGRGERRGIASPGAAEEPPPGSTD